MTNQIRIPYGNDFKFRIVVTQPTYTENETIFVDFDITQCTDINLALQCDKHDIVIPLEWELEDNTNNVVIANIVASDLEIGSSYGIFMTGKDAEGKAFRWKLDGSECFSIVDDTNAADLGPTLLDFYDINARIGMVSPTGPQGPQGDIGPQGPEGQQGAQGPKGVKGDTGERGYQGNVGPQGPEGPRGKKGDKGDTGDKGDRGAQGREGVQGPIGPQGPQGEIGLTGPQGEQGEAGIGFRLGEDNQYYVDNHIHITQGDGIFFKDDNDWNNINIGQEGIEFKKQGQHIEFYNFSDESDHMGHDNIRINSPAGRIRATDYLYIDPNQLQPISLRDKIAELEQTVGVQGPQGPQGPKGEDGYQGRDGATGPQGPEGQRGQRGYQGDKGDKGDKGAQGREGTQGPEGPRGPRGYQGEKGDTGDRGPQGREGAQGPEGPRGPRGYQGPAGNDGTNGRDGAQGPQGEKGATGPQGPEGPQGPAGSGGGSQGPQGPQGPQGDIGPQGPEGPQGAQGTDFEDNFIVTAVLEAKDPTCKYCPNGESSVYGFGILIWDATGNQGVGAYRGTIYSVQYAANNIRTYLFEEDNVISIDYDNMYCTISHAIIDGNAGFVDGVEIDPEMCTGHKLIEGGYTDMDGETWDGYAQALDSSSHARGIVYYMRYVNGFETRKDREAAIEYKVCAFNLGSAPDIDLQTNFKSFNPVTAILTTYKKTKNNGHNYFYETFNAKISNVEVLGDGVIYNIYHCPWDGVAYNYSDGSHWPQKHLTTLYTPIQYQVDERKNKYVDDIPLDLGNNVIIGNQGTEQYVANVAGTQGYIASSTTGLKIEVVASLPANPDANTIYIIN